MGVKFSYDDGEIRQRAKLLDENLDIAIRLIIDLNATKGETMARIEAPWSDRTGAARSGLHAITGHTEEKHVIIISHSVHYGIWLEVKNSGEYEIIMPTIRKTGREVMADLNNLFARL